VADTSGIDWIELLIQVILAAIGVAIIAGARSRRRPASWAGHRGRPARRADRCRGKHWRRAFGVIPMGESEWVAVGTPA
jgi:hypothetical protein